MKKALCICVFIFVMTGVSFAQQGFERKNNYIGLEGGLFIPTGSYEEPGIKLDHESGGDFGLKYVHYFNTNIGINIRLSRTSFDSEKVDLEIIGTTFTAHNEYETITFGAGLTGRLPITEFIDLQGDVGVAYNSNKIKIILEGMGIEVSDSDSGSAFGFFIDAGVNFIPIPELSVGALFRYSTNNQSFEDDRDDIDLGGMSFLLTVGYMF